MLSLLSQGYAHLIFVSNLKNNLYTTCRLLDFLIRRRSTFFAGVARLGRPSNSRIGRLQTSVPGRIRATGSFFAEAIASVGGLSLFYQRMKDWGGFIDLINTYEK